MLTPTPTSNTPAATTPTGISLTLPTPKATAAASPSPTAIPTATAIASVPTTTKPPAAAAGPGLQPFTAPPLAEIDAKAQWIDMPVDDSLKLMEAEWKKIKPLGTVAEALALKNDSDEANAKILDALGRLPENDAQVNYGATITRFLKADVKSTNPIMFNSVEEGDVGGLMSYGLFSFDWNMRPFATKESVKSWQVSKDRMYDKVVLRDDAVWSDGKPITARDVVFSFKTILDTRIPIPAVRSQTDELRWVEAYDDYTLIYFHKEASPTNVWKVNFPIIPKHIYEVGLEKDTTLQDSEYHVKLENDPVVGGPYKLVKRERGQQLVLERREDYYMFKGKQVRDKPYFKTVRFSITQDLNVALLALKKGDLDEMILSPEQWVQHTGNSEFYDRNTKARGVEWVYFYFGWNMKEPSAPFFADLKVRQAMGYAFDHEEMLKTLCFGLFEPCTGIFHPEAWMAPKKMPPSYTYNIDKAEELLDEAGWTDSDGDGIRDKEINGKRVPFDFTIICSTVPTRIAICNLLRQNLKEIGVNCTVRPLEATILSDALIKHNYQANFGGWGTGADPSTLKNIYKTGEGRNFNQYSNPEVDKLLKQAELEFDRNKQAELYAKIHELIYADQPATFLYFQHSFYGFNKQLRGYRFSPRGPYHYGPGFGSIWKAGMQ
ncbi:MAG: peptide ABC transporter substrate-binding protein [Planctomycetia bacterium]|nr:peptide ABC transporter substrate-binding protein [Planctomycetia bacterium]